MRLFVAIPIPEQATRELSAVVDRMRHRPGADALRWSPPESWHVTLQFLDGGSAALYDALVGALHTVRARPVEIVPAGLGVFTRPGIFHARVEATPELLQLEKHITAATSSCGFAREDRPYVPHITLARQGRGRHRGTIWPARELGTFSTFTADAFALYESFLGHGARYEVRERFRLSA